MCLENVKHNGRKYTFGYKVFGVDEDGNLHPIHKEYEFAGNINNKIIFPDEQYGSYVFTNKRDAFKVKKLLDRVDDSKNLYDNYIVKKVHVGDIFEWGFQHYDINTFMQPRNKINAFKTDYVYVIN